MTLFFCKKLLLFLLPILFLIIILEIYLRQINTTYSIKEKGLVDSSSKVELLILGNSHASYDIDPDQFKVYTYNLAEVNQSLYFDKRITLKHINKLSKLKFVFISLDFHSLYFSSQGIRDVWSYYGNKIEYRNSLNWGSKISRINGYTPQVVATFLKRDFKNRKREINVIDLEAGANYDVSINKGFFFLDGTDEKLLTIDACKERAFFFMSIIKNSKEKNTILKDLEEFIYQLKAKNITPIFITAPGYETYKKMLDNKLLHQNESDIIIMAHRMNIEYWNYFNMPLKKKYFHDSDHLNLMGAKAFSKILSLRLEKFAKKS